MQYSLYDFFRHHRLPLIAKFGQYCIERVAPHTTHIAAAGAHKHCRSTNERTLALKNRPKYLADQNRALHLLSIDRRIGDSGQFERLAPFNTRPTTPAM